MKCTDHNCNQEEGHPGPCGGELRPGLIVAPHPKEGTDREPCDLECNSCGKPMVITRRVFGGGGVLKCTACNQLHTFNADGYSYHTCTLVTLDGTKELPTAWIPRRIKHYRWLARAEAVLGLTGDTAKYASSLPRLEQEAERMLKEYSNRSWWQRLLDWFKR